MWESRPSPTSAATPEVTPILRAAIPPLAFAFLAAVALAEPPAPPANPRLPATRTPHFTVASPANAAERGRVLETAYTAFVAVTNVRADVLPAHTTVVIHPNAREFRRATGLKRGSARRKAGTIETFEQANLRSLLVRELAIHYFDTLSNRSASRERIAKLRFLASGIADAVEGHVAGIEPSERRLRLRASFARRPPVGPNQLLGTRKMRRDAASARRFRDTAGSVTAYLLDQDKGLGFPAFLAELSAGRSVDDAIARAYPGRFRGAAELYDRWAEKELSSLPRRPRTPARSRR